MNLYYNLYKKCTNCMNLYYNLYKCMNLYYTICKKRTNYMNPYVLICTKISEKKKNSGWDFNPGPIWLAIVAAARHPPPCRLH